MLPAVAAQRRPIDEIGWDVGYEDPAFFRRLFKRFSDMTPGAYRRKFQGIAIDY